MNYNDCKEAFAEPGSNNLIDLIHPNTGKSLINGETLEQVREREIPESRDSKRR